MMRRLVRPNSPLRRIFPVKNSPRHRNYVAPLSRLQNPPKLLVTTHCALLTKEAVHNIDLNLQEAADVGQDAVIELMDILKENILRLCVAYKECLKNQIKIIEEATALGPFSEKWNDLPEYRSLGIQLIQELDSFTTAIRAVGQMIRDDTMQHITQQEAHIKTISEKYEELEALLQKQLKEIMNLEAQVLEVNQKSILETR